jgi:hypothetical protein
MDLARRPYKKDRTNLPDLAMEIVTDVDRLRVRPVPVRSVRGDRVAHNPAPSSWLFASPQGDRSLTAAALTRALNRNRSVLGIGDASVHDLRRTFATVHGEIGTSPAILKALLNHTPQEITERVYNLAAYPVPRRRAMGAWCVVGGRDRGSEADSEGRPDRALGRLITASFHGTARRFPMPGIREKRTHRPCNSRDTRAGRSAGRG